MIKTEGEKLKIASSIDNIALVEQLVDKVCEKYNVNEDSYGTILVAVTEAVNNAINIGNNGNPNKQIKIECINKDKNLQFSVTDEGIGFDYDSLPDPTDPINMDTPQGTSVFLMKQLADKVEFNQQGKEVLLTFNLN
jgi:serine/threonine-protein kinase RsbW